MNSRPPKIHSLHTYVVLWIHWCVANCIEHCVMFLPDCLSFIFRFSTRQKARSRRRFTAIKFQAMIRPFLLPSTFHNGSGHKESVKKSIFTMIYNFLKNETRKTKVRTFTFGDMLDLKVKSISSAIKGRSQLWKSAQYIALKWIGFIFLGGIVLTIHSNITQLG